MKKPRATSLLGLIALAAADDNEQMTQGTVVFRAFASSPSHNQSLGTAMVARVMHHAPVTDTTWKWGGVSGLLRPVAAANHASAAAGHTGFQRIVNPRLDWQDLA